MSNPEVAEGVARLFNRRSRFILIGLTGRTGSGCTETASLLTKTWVDLRLPAANLTNPNAEERKYRIVKDFGELNWKPFFSISISNVILSYLLDYSELELRKFFNESELLAKQDRLSQFISDWQPAYDDWQRVRKVLLNNQSTAQSSERAEFLNKWQTTIQQFFNTVRRGLDTESTKLLQQIGDNLRKSGHPFDSTHVPDRFYELPDRVASLIELIKTDQESKNQPCYIVLDTLRNPFELLYFRERYAGFYVVAVSSPEEDRKNRLQQRKNLTSKQVDEIDSKEYPEKSNLLVGYDAFTSQNIQSCLEKADIYLTNNGHSLPNQEIDLSGLGQQIVKYFSLMLHPGLTTPTRDERCMQIAFAARANSGCISRQVGAAITDENHSVKAVGWNDVPAGQVPCLLRRASDLIAGQDQQAFSDYENKNVKFRQRVGGTYKRYSIVDAQGRSSSFCFKSEYNALTKEKNQVHTRSLHAEENAFLQIVKQGGQGIQGGKLYTTASPCELCAKKAFQLGIKQIFYIDPYPGISMTHILMTGGDSVRPKVALYQGAVGTAYHKLYDPVLPFKDEIFAIMEGKNNPQSDSHLANRLL